jgi:hypothetical protein
MTKRLGMRGAGRMLAAMAAMGAGLHDVGGYARPRERYDRWCALWVRHDWESRVVAATRKRARKAAKRLRDAELTRLGARRALDGITFRSVACGPSPRPEWADALLSHLVRGFDDDTKRMRRIRRGEVTP